MPLRDGVWTGNPEIGSVSDVRSWAAKHVQLGGQISGRARLVRRAINLLDGQSGQSITAMRILMGKLEERHNKLAERHQAAANIGTWFAQGLEDIQGRAGSMTRQGATLLAQIRRNPLDAPHNGSLDQFMTLSRRWHALCNERNEFDRQAVKKLAEIPAGQYVPGRGVQKGFTADDTAMFQVVTRGIMNPGGVNAEDLRKLSEVPNGHEAIRALWDVLSADQRQNLINAAPLLLGNLNGIPLMYRDLANRITITDMLGELQPEYDALRATLARLEIELEHYINLRNYPDTNWYASQRQGFVQAEIDELRRQLGPLSEQVTWLGHLLSGQIPHVDDNGNPYYRPAPGVVAFDLANSSIITFHGRFNDYGDIRDDVVNVGVHVPGTGTTMQDFLRIDALAYDLNNAANDMTTDRPSAMFAFGGGPFPTIPQAPNPALAQSMAPDLAGFVNSLNTCPERNRVTVSGHSYGGAVVGLAMLAGMRVDNVVHVSSAGLGHGVGSLDDLPASAADTTHFAVTPRRDFIRSSQGVEVGSLGHGASPHSDPRVIDTEPGWVNTDIRDQTVDGNFHYGRGAAGAALGGVLGPLGALGGFIIGGNAPRAFESHSDVLARNSTSFNTVAAIVAGEPVLAFNHEGTPAYGERPNMPESRPGGEIWLPTR
ncbi:MAG: alpha/beta hydrolase family protein [Promicromonosporaceae bacterium]|nr:alpha/beta hydrolase family protein [Promicromonosporaceae bacterium]